jgi:hypothetical protein
LDKNCETYSSLKVATGFVRNSRFYALKYILNTWRRPTWRIWRQIWRQIHRVIIITSNYFILYIILRIIKKTSVSYETRSTSWYKISQCSFPHIVRTAYRTESVLCSFYRHFDGDYYPVVEKGWKGLERPQKWKKCEYSENKYWEVQFFFGDSGVTIFYFRGVQFFGGYNFLFSAIRKIDRGWSIFLFWDLNPTSIYLRHT